MVSVLFVQIDFEIRSAYTHRSAIFDEVCFCNILTNIQDERKHAHTHARNEMLGTKK